MLRSLVGSEMCIRDRFNAPRLGRFQLLHPRKKPRRKRPSFLLSCHEVSSIFHPPTHKTETLATSRFIQLEPPRDLPATKSEKNLMLIGETCFHSKRDRFGLLDRDASLHGFCVGSSGSGKTTLLTTAILSLITRGQGITLVDFHGDFARSIQKAIPNRLKNKVIEFSPLSDSPIAFNPLFSADAKRWPVVTDSVLSLSLIHI